MKFSELTETQKGAEERIGIDRKCLYCGNITWNIAKQCRGLVISNHQNRFFHEHAISMTCTRCGFKIFVDPEILGLETFATEDIEDDDE
jgi:DNA-directed RNA polymerase subunit RPC12/RpoP